MTPLRLCCVLLLLSGQTTASPFHDPYCKEIKNSGEIFMSKYVEVGQPLNITCKLNKTLAQTCGFNSSDIHFKIRQYDFNLPKIVDSNTAELYVSNVTFPVGLHCVLCNIQHENTTTTLRAELFYYGFLPCKLHVEDIRIKNWKNLTIKWSKSDKKCNNDVILTNYSILILRHNSCKTSFFSGKSATGSSEISCDNLNITDELLSVKIIGSNHLGTTQSAVNNTLKSLIVAGKVSLKEEIIGQREVILIVQYESPENVSVEVQKHIDTVNMTYQVSRNFHGNKTVLQTQFTSNKSEVRFDFEDLSPDTRYQFCFRCRSENSAYWGDDECYDVTTREAVPDQPPQVTDGAFYEEIKTDGNRKKLYRDVTIFWKNIPDEQKNGEIQGYKLNILAKGKLSEKTFDVSHGSLFKYTLKSLELKERYQFFLNARTSAGYSSFDIQALVLAPHMEMPQGPEFTFVTVDEMRTVIVMWKPFQGGVTVFWCSKTSDQCSSELQWKRCNGSDGRMRISYPKGETSMSNKRFGSSITIDRVSSGITWTMCVYDNSSNQVPSEPLVDQIDMTSTEIVLKIYRYRENCKAYISHFVLKYCMCGEGVCLTHSIEKVLSLKDGNRYRLWDLKPNTSYCMNMTSMAGNRSSVVIKKTYRTLQTDFSALWIIPFIVPLGIAAFGMYIFTKHARQRYHKYRQPIQINLEMERRLNVIAEEEDATSISTHFSPSVLQAEVPIHSMKGRKQADQELHNENIETSQNVPAEKSSDEAIHGKDKILVINPKIFQYQFSFSSSNTDMADDEEECPSKSESTCHNIAQVEVHKERPNDTSVANRELSWENSASNYKESLSHTVVHLPCEVINDVKLKKNGNIAPLSIPKIDSDFETLQFEEFFDLNTDLLAKIEETVDVNSTSDAESYNENILSYSKVYI